MGADKEWNPGFWGGLHDQDIIFALPVFGYYLVLRGAGSVPDTKSIG